MIRKVPIMSITLKQDDDRLMTPAEVSEFLNITIASLAWLRSAKTGPPHVYAGRHVRYWFSDVLAWLEPPNSDHGQAS